MNTSSSSTPISDFANAWHFIAAHGPHLRYVPTWGWLYWDGKRWRHDANDLHVTHLARQILLSLHNENSINASRLDTMLSIARCDPSVVTTRAAFDANPLLLNINNGIFNLQSSEFRPHNPLDLLTRLIPVDYNPLAATHEEHDLIAEFLKDCCTPENECSIKAIDLYHAYLAWCQERRLRPDSLMAFFLSIQKHGYRRERKSTGKVYHGLILKPAPITQLSDQPACPPEQSGSPMPGMPPMPDILTESVPHYKSAPPTEPPDSSMPDIPTKSMHSHKSVPPTEQPDFPMPGMSPMPGMLTKPVHSDQPILSTEPPDSSMPGMPPMLGILMESVHPDQPAPPPQLPESFMPGMAPMPGILTESMHSEQPEQPDFSMPGMLTKPVHSDQLARPTEPPDSSMPGMPPMSGILTESIHPEQPAPPLFSSSETNYQYAVTFEPITPAEIATLRRRYSTNP